LVPSFDGSDDLVGIFCPDKGLWVAVGVVDEADLPLNISREMLQNNPHVTQMRKALTGRVISELENLADNEPEAFGKVWDAFGAILDLALRALLRDVGQEGAP
jgi:HSP90 family molecular chaperone